MFGASSGSALGRSASFSFSQPPANKPFSGTSGGFTFGGTSSASTTNTATAPASSQSAATAAPASTSGFSFGAAPKPAGTTGGLFGSAATTSQPAQTGGLFGSSSTTTSQPQQTVGLFGSSQPQQQQQQQQQQQTGGGLFGSSTTTAQPATGGGLFGGQSTGTGGLFGSSTTTTNTGGGLFGSATAQAPKPAGFGFGASTAAPAVGGFGQSQAAFQPAQSQQAAASPFARFGYYQKERFNDLADDARKLVEELDSYMTSQMQIKDELKTRDFGSEIRKCAAEWHELDSALKSLAATLESDTNQCKDVAERVEQDRADNATLYAIASNAREGRSDGSGFIEWLQRYFAKQADEFRQRIQRYRSVMETVERHLQSLDKRDQYTPQAISDVIHAQHASFMALAAEVASLHSEVDSLKKDYTKWYQQTHKSFRDPFGSMNQLASSVAP